MGNNSNQAISNTENNNKPKEKDEIFKGTYQDKFNVKESDPKDFYDLIINIKSIKEINNGWDIKMKEKGKLRFEEYKNKLNEKKELKKKENEKK